MKKEIRPTYIVSFQRIPADLIRKGDLVLMLPCGDEEVMKEPVMFVADKNSTPIKDKHKEYEIMVDNGLAWKLPRLKLKSRGGSIDV